MGDKFDGRCGSGAKSFVPPAWRWRFRGVVVVERTVLMRPGRVRFGRMTRPGTTSLATRRILIGVGHVNVYNDRVRSCRNLRPTAFCPIIRKRRCSKIIVTMNDRIAIYGPNSRVATHPRLIYNGYGPYGHKRCGIYRRLHIRTFRTSNTTRSFFIMSSSHITGLPRNVDLSCNTVVRPSTINTRTDGHASIGNGGMMIDNTKAVNGLVTRFYVTHNTGGMLVASMDSLHLTGTHRYNVGRALGVAGGALGRTTRRLFNRRNCRMNFRMTNMRISVHSLVRAVRGNDSVIIITIFTGSPTLDVFCLNRRRLELVNSVVCHRRSCLATVSCMDGNVIGLGPLMDGHFTFRRCSSTCGFVSARHRADVGILVSFRRGPKRGGWEVRRGGRATGSYEG